MRLVECFSVHRKYRGVRLNSEGGYIVFSLKKSSLATSICHLACIMLV